MYIKFFKIITLIFFIVSNQTIKAQDSLYVRVNTGFAGYFTPVDGYYFSFDLGIPVVKGIEIAPTFTFETNQNFKEIDFYLNNWENTQDIENEKKINSGQISGLVELYVFVKPLTYIKNKKITQTDFGIGVGYGFTFYSKNNYFFEENGNLISVKNQSGRGKSFSAKTYYNYHIKNYFIGLVFGINSFYFDDPISTFGLQFGVKL